MTKLTFAEYCVFYCCTECLYAECHSAECGGAIIMSRQLEISDDMLFAKSANDNSSIQYFLFLCVTPL
jgi:hypothetical protein